MGCVFQMNNQSFTMVMVGAADDKVKNIWRKKVIACRSNV